MLFISIFRLFSNDYLLIFENSYSQINCYVYVYVEKVIHYIYTYVQYTYIILIMMKIFS